MTFLRRVVPTRGRRHAARVAATVATSVVLAACSGGSADSAGGGEGVDGVVVDSMNPVTTVEAPTEAFEPPTKQRITVLYCGSAGQGCVTEAKETKRAAEALGWTVDLVDGKLDPTVWNQSVKQAVAAQVDGIIAISADPNLMTDAMAEVEKAGIPFVLTNQVPRKSDVKGVDSYFAPDPAKGGEDVADWIIADSGGKADVLLLDLPGFDSAETRTGAIADRLAADCDGCTVKKADIAVQTMGTSLAPLVTSQLQKNSDIDYVWSPDDCCVSFVQQGIQQAGRDGSLKVISTGGFADQLKNVSNGRLAADQATATLYLSWLSVDGLARVIADEPYEQYWPVPQRLWTEANIGEASDDMFTRAWNTDLDYEAMFKKMWGKG